MPSATLSRPMKLETKEFRLPFLHAKAVDGEAGVVEAIVAVTGNTDDGGDVILPGAFKFKRHPKIVWSHDLRTLIGKVLEYAELTKDDPRLPADLKAKGLGGLWFKIQFDLEDPESFTAYRKVVFHEDLGWSIGYEVDPRGAKVLKDGRRALSIIYVWEASPASFGMNEEARTVSVKSLLTSTVEDLGLSPEKAKALQDLLTTIATPDEAKSYPALEGSFEETQDALRGAVQAYGVEVFGERGEDNDWWCNIEGTFEDRVVVTFRFYGSDQENVTYQFPYTEGDDGAIELGEPSEVEVTATVTPATGGSTTTETETTPAATEGEMAAEAAKVLASLEGLEVKKGAVLSEANASALTAALEAIQKVLKAATTKKDDPEETPAKRKVTPKGETKPPAKAEKPEAKKDGDLELETKDGDALTPADLLEMTLAVS